MGKAKLIGLPMSSAPELTPLQPPRRKQPLQEPLAAAILEAAARVLAKGGEQASMNDVAAAAGVARATLYRYFPSRQALLDELGRVAADEAGTRLASARIEEIAAREGINRAVRALVGLVVSVLSSRPVLGREDTIAALAALFLEGARSRPTPVSAEV